MGYTDYFLIVSARNERHIQALQSHLERQLRKAGFRCIGQNNQRNQKWAILDYNDFVVHVFQIDQREVYDLEGLWHEAEQLEFVPQAG